MNEEFACSPEVVIDMAKAAKAVLPQTVSQADDALSTIVGWFNNVVLYHVKRANLEYHYKLEHFEEDLKAKLSNVTSDRLCEPKLSIAGPTLEALKYTFDEESLREMYVNLLASSMDCDRAPSAHPAFVEIIKQLSPFDAKFLSLFLHKSTFPGITLVERHADNKLTPYLATLLDLFECTAQFDYSETLGFTSVIDNLIRLGLVIKNSAIIELNYDYEKFKSNTIYQSYVSSKASDSRIEMMKFRIELTSFGLLFKKCCM